MKEKIFVYGTLKKGGKWHHLIENEDYLGQDTVRGEMYLEAGGYYPILFQGEEEIPGEIYEVSPKALEAVVELESDANYMLVQALTANGIPVELFYFTDESQKDPKRKLSEFDAKYYFEKWKKESE